MVLFVIQLVLLFAGTITSLTLNITKAASNNVPGRIQRETLPNPYRVPGEGENLPNPYHVPKSPIFLDFYQPALGDQISRSVTMNLFDQVREAATDRLLREGDGPIEPGVHRFKFLDHVFVYESIASERRMRYSEVLCVIRGFVTKERVDGFRHRVATVLFEGEDGRVVETGEVGFLKIASGGGGHDVT